MSANGVPMDNIAAALANFAVDRIVINRTGLEGAFDAQLRFATAVRPAPQFQKRKIFRSTVALFLAARFTGDEEPARRFVRSSVVCCGIT